jgi:hypothetical protein
MGRFASASRPGAFSAAVAIDVLGWRAARARR